MENASKALLMAGGILIGVLILALMVTLFVSSSNLSSNYDETKQAEAIQQFNVNFTQYSGKYLTIYEAITVCNFAQKMNNKITDVDIINRLEKNQISIDLEDARKAILENYSGKNVKVDVVYEMKIIDYNEDGYVSKIQFLDRKLRIIEYDENNNISKTEYDYI